MRFFDSVGQTKYDMALGKGLQMHVMHGESNHSLAK